MLCKIADILTEVPAADGLDVRCQDYLCGDGEAEIVISKEKYRRNRYNSNVRNEMIAYMESAAQFYCKLLEFGGFYLHSSAVVLHGKAYLFSGHSGAGKSTHARLWESVFGSEVHVINDDKPAIRYIDGEWIVYGTPWCGKDGINENAKAPLAGVCFMKQADKNSIRRLSMQEALQKIISQTIYKFDKAEHLDLLLDLMNHFLEEIPIYELENRPESEAVQLSYKTMVRGAQEMKR